MSLAPETTVGPVLSESEQYMQVVQTYLHEQYDRMLRGEIPQSSAEEIFTFLLARGLDARKKGNYGIAAAVYYCDGETEVIIFGENDMITGHNPVGHAEVNSIRRTTEILKLPPEEQTARLSQLVASGDVVVRPASPGSKIGIRTYTSLEQCPMCTEVTLYAGVRETVIGVIDDHGGGMDRKRIEPLTEIWRRWWEGLDAEGAQVRDPMKVIYAQCEDMNQRDTYIPERLQQLLVDLFIHTLGPIDQKLETDPFFSEQRFEQLVQTSRAESIQTEPHHLAHVLMLE